MALLNWLTEHWFDLLQTIGIVGGLYFTSVTLRTDTKVRRLESLLTLTKSHREIWSEIYRRPDLIRILDPKADLKAQPVSGEERLFVNFLIFHLNNSYRAIQDGLYMEPEGLGDDIKGFFSLPIPAVVWVEGKGLQDRDFVSFVDNILTASKEHGFTLIELLVVISVIGLLSSIVLAALSSARDKTQIAAGRQFASSLDNVVGDQAALAWDFDECSGSVANDRSGNGNNGNTSAGGLSWSPTNTPNSSGCSMKFNGGNADWAVISLTSANAALKIYGDVTESAWIYPTGGSGDETIIREGCGSDTIYSLYFEPTTSNLAFSYWTSSAWVTIYSTAGTISLNKWTHVAAVRSGTTLSFYVNGQLTGSGTVGAPPGNPASQFAVGAFGYGGGFTGYIDSVRVYAKALTASEVGKLYASESPRFNLAAK